MDSVVQLKIVERLKSGASLSGDGKKNNTAHGGSTSIAQNGALFQCWEEN